MVDVVQSGKASETRMMTVSVHHYQHSVLECRVSGCGVIL